MSEKMQLLFAHILCCAMIIACFVVSETVLKTQPTLGRIVVGVGMFLWGKIGFKPSEPVVELMLEHLTPAQVHKVASLHPPALVVPAVPAAPPPLGQSKRGTPE